VGANPTTVTKKGKIMKTVDEIIDESIECEIFTQCKDYGHTRDEFNPEYIKEELVNALVEKFMNEHYPRGEYLG
tara:strand:- start:3183 stop:3404 length:222 start_codon:yes stop_codon:yes gene_type:complete